MKLSTANIAAAIAVAAAVAPNGASASPAEHAATEQRELWGSGYFKWTPKEPKECYDVSKIRAPFFLFLISVGLSL